MDKRVLVINPGSTSTKLALFCGTEKVFDKTLRHSREDLQPFAWVMEQADFRRVLNGFLRKLTRQSRTYFIRRYWYGESIREIADSCGAGEEKVKSSLFRTRQRLRAALEKEVML